MELWSYREGLLLYTVVVLLYIGWQLIIPYGTRN